jgi:glycosyltransferase involved in cell wall biosynthesis
MYGGMGGLSTYFMRFVETDHEGLFDNAVLYFGIEPPLGEYVNFCDCQNIRHFTVMKRQGLDLWSYLKVLAILFRHRPDVVLIHSTTVCPPVFFYSNLKRCRTVFIEHTAGPAKTRADWYASRLAQRFADHVVVFYDRQIKQLAEKLGGSIRCQKITTIPKSIDAEKFTRQTRQDRRGIVIGMQSRFAPARDHATLLRAFAALLANGSPCGLELRLAGDGSTRSQHEALARELGIADRVVFTGTLTQPQLSDFLRDLDIYVHSSTGETNCFSIMEAQAAGLPIVATDVEGINDVIQHGVDGFLFKLGDVRQLTAILSRLIGEQPLRAQYGQVSRRLIEDDSRRTNMAQEFYKMLEDGK